MKTALYMVYTLNSFALRLIKQVKNVESVGITRFKVFISDYYKCIFMQ